MPLGSVNVAALGAWMARRGGYLRSLGENAPLAWVAPRPAVGGAGFAVLGRPDPNMPCARAAAATRRMPRMPRRVLIADLRSCAPAVWAAAGHRSEERRVGKEGRSR